MNDWFLLSVLGAAAGMTLAARLPLHYFQLESYQFQGYFRTLGRQWKKAFLPGILLALAHAAALLLLALAFPGLSAPDYLIHGLLAVILAGAGWLLCRQAAGMPQKKKFALTARMKRLYAALAAVCCLLMLLPFLLSRQAAGTLAGSRALGAMIGRAVLPLYLPMLLLPCVVALAALIALPIEKLIFHLYFRDAEKKLLENPRLIRIGITGSYGKTSTKFILAEILSQKYNVLATPASFNTPMGVTRIIRERLTPSHQVFIGEMGARHVGEIRELSRLVHPQIGILTAVGPQHLDTFKTLERIEKTKYELIDALPEDGLAVFLDDDGIVRKLYDKTPKPKLLAAREGADAWAENMTVSPQGCHFTLRFGDGKAIECDTVLLGEHNVMNILGASLVARHLGLSDEQIARGISGLRPVEHRLQLIRTPNGIGVIDDAFNTNPRSSRQALKVLSSFPGRRLIVTPGMVELGGDEERYNEEFGQAMAGAVDIAVLVGKRHTAPIRKGLMEKGFPEEKIHTVASLEEAVAVVNGLIRPGDTVMYENDLPDHYSEG
ncbi:MAG: UDP-N-acetylmuramoyl-tripeptide--D-alanyl-D-alanine ligase [Clostridiales bacterium]|nr:UDP-N-acetylmuramoyl-tripeptide--D-alanyl-D-alanine ligase [Clostridiales bacterium]